MIALVLAAAVATTAPATEAAPAAPDASTRKGAVDQSIREVLGGEQYLFCHDPEYPLYLDELGWCPLAGDPNPRCPSLPRACKGDAAGYKPKSGGGAGAKDGEAQEPRSWKLPSLGGLGLVLLYLLIGSALAAIIYAIVHALAQPHDAPERDDQRPEAETPAQAAAAARGPIETDVERLLALARAAADRGEFARALDFLYAALLRRLDGDGLIRIRPWRTNGDYLRDLRERPDLRADVKAIVREIERVQFGAAQASGDLYGALLGRVLPMVSRTLAALALIATVLGASSCFMRSRGREDNTPSGTHAILDVLAKSGFQPQQRLAPLSKIAGDAETLVLLPGAHVDAAVWDKLLDWVKAGNTLVVATGSHHLPMQLGVEVAPAQAEDPKHAADKKTPAPDGRVAIDFAGELGDFSVKVPERGQLRLLAGSEATPLLKRGDAIYAAAIELGEGTAIVLADDYLFMNASLATADNAAFLVALLDRYNQKIEFSDESTGVAPANPAAAITRGKLAPLTLQLALMLGLFFLYRGVAFGALRDPPTESRRSFVEHVRALGAQYAKARAARHALQLYSTYVMDRLRDTARLGGPGSLHRLAEIIALRTQRPLGDVMRLLVEAKTARETPQARSLPAEDLAIMRELGQLMKDIGGTREHPGR